MYKYAFILLLCLMPVAVFAKPTCQDHPSGPYCSYTGKVASIYVNTSNTILVYFDAPVDVSLANSFGMNITNSVAAAVSNENPEFAKMFYSTALTAQASGRAISIQMRGNHGGYLKIDRIWLAAPK